MERTFLDFSLLGNECSTNVPYVDFSLPGTKVRNKKSTYHFRCDASGVVFCHTDVINCNLLMLRLNITILLILTQPYPYLNPNPIPTSTIAVCTASHVCTHLGEQIFLINILPLCSHVTIITLRILLSASTLLLDVVM